LKIVGVDGGRRVCVVRLLPQGCSKRIRFGVCSKALLGDLVRGDGFGNAHPELKPVDLGLQVARRQVTIDLGGDARVLYP